MATRPSLGYVLYRDAGTVHITLEPLRHFVNMSGFVYTGYTTILDVSALQNAVNLAHIDIYRDTFEVSNLESLLSLPNLRLLFVPFGHLWDPVLGLFDERCVRTGMGG